MTRVEGEPILVGLLFETVLAPRNMKVCYDK